MFHRCFGGWRARAALALLAFTALGTSACQTVEFYEKEAFSDGVMLLDEDPTLTHFRQKVYYSREGATGGIGDSAGGGCGCY
jgi:hypothetical protein